VGLGAVAAAILNRFIRRDGDSHFLMELPIYRWPQARVSLNVALRRTTSYLRKAGPTILFFVLLLWVGTHVPYSSQMTPTEQLESSVVGRAGQLIEPVFRPLGLDWRAGLGIMSAFVAREVFVSSLAVIFNLAGDAVEAAPDSLLERMHQAKLPDGTALFTTASVIGLLVYFLIALQCLSTTSITWREMGSAKFAIAQLVVMNVLAYVVAVGAVQGLRALGVA